MVKWDHKPGTYTILVQEMHAFFVYFLPFFSCMKNMAENEDPRDK